LADAVGSFRAEAVLQKLLKSARESHFPDDPVKTPQLIVSAQELYLLQLLVGLDGDFSLPGVPTAGTPNIYCRVFHYRLSLFGLYTGPTGDSYSASTEQAWNKFQAWLAPLKRNKALELTGDLDQLIALLKNTRTFKNSILYFRYENKKQESVSISQENNRMAFLTQLGENIDVSSKEFSMFKKYANTRFPDQTFLQKQSESELNKFMLRLMQLHQWTSGHYLGTIDGEIGEITFNSFIELARSEVENGNINFRFQFFVVHLEGDYWAVNCHYFFKHLQYEKQEHSNIEDLFREFSRQYENLSPNNKKNADLNLKSAWKEINVSKNQDFKSTRYRPFFIFIVPGHFIPEAGYLADENHVRTQCREYHGAQAFALVTDPACGHCLGKN